MMKIVFAGIIAGSLWCLPTAAQINFSDIRDWDKVLAKAKAEHKDVFVDCYATWCAPCKWMDANVYADKAVGQIYNRDFICIRLQMDKTAGDDAFVKGRYYMANQLNADYHIAAYPTYLFFDAEGKPLHKGAGSMEKKAFLKLAADSKNPEKQYYTLLKNFEPGKLDTGEERALALSTKAFDKTLASNLAMDYLHRLPEKDLTKWDIEDFLWQFQEDPQVTSFVNHYLDRHANHPDKSLLLNLAGNPYVKEIARNYIDKLLPDSLYTAGNIDLMAHFSMTNLYDRGFKFFLENVEIVDEIVKTKGFAQNCIVQVVYKTTLNPLVKKTQTSGQIPDFETMKNRLTQEYGEEIANRVLIDAKLDWFRYQVDKKKDTTYAGPLVNEQIKHIVAEHWDPSGNERSLINNICYSVIFFNSTTKEQLRLPLSWMKEIVARHPDDMSSLDTYACLLYKDGDTRDAIEMENKALAIAIQESKVIKGFATNVKEFEDKISDMKKDKKIWIEKN